MHALPIKKDILPITLNIAVSTLLLTLVMLSTITG